MSTIEYATSNDGPSVLGITGAAGVFSPTEFSCVEELWNAWQDRNEASGYTFLVYRDDDRVLGFACFGSHPLTQGAFDLYWLAVDPVARGRGVGHALLSRVEAEIRERGGRLLLIETSDTPAYAAARRLYESSGYGREAIVHDFYALGDNLLIFSKDLAPSIREREVSGEYQGSFAAVPQ
jgi:ribosomal protein S18 acetylase RimI-like enzyme